MKYAGILFILLSAGLISGEYSSYVKKRLSECRDFLSFIGHMKIQVGCFLRPANELVEGFNSKSLYRGSYCGRNSLRGIRSGGTPPITLGGGEGGALWTFFFYRRMLS